MVNQGHRSKRSIRLNSASHGLKPDRNGIVPHPYKCNGIIALRIFSQPGTNVITIAVSGGYHAVVKKSNNVDEILEGDFDE